MSPIYELTEWLKLSPDLANHKFFVGLWSDSSSSAGDKVVSLMSEGGPSRDVDVGRRNVRVRIMTEQNATSTANAKKALVYTSEQLTQRLRTDYRTCGIAQIRLIGDIIGPGQTAENRLWCELNLQLTTF